MFEDEGLAGWGNFDQAQVLFRGETSEGGGGEARGGNGFDEELGDLFGCLLVDDAVGADDAAEGRDGVRGQGLGVGLEDGGAVAAPQGLVCLMMATMASPAAPENSWVRSQQASRSTRLL